MKGAFLTNLREIGPIEARVLMKSLMSRATIARPTTISPNVPANPRMSQMLRAKGGQEHLTRRIPDLAGEKRVDSAPNAGMTTRKRPVDSGMTNPVIQRKRRASAVTAKMVPYV